MGFQTLLPLGKLLFLLRNRLLMLLKGLLLLLEKLLLLLDFLLLALKFLELQVEGRLGLEQFRSLLAEDVGPVLKFLLDLDLFGFPLSLLALQGLALDFQLGFSPIQVLLATMNPGFDLGPFLALALQSGVLFHLDSEVGFLGLEGFDVFLKLLDLGLESVHLFPGLTD